MYLVFQNCFTRSAQLDDSVFHIFPNSTHALLTANCDFKFPPPFCSSSQPSSNTPTGTSIQFDSFPLLLLCWKLTFWAFIISLSTSLLLSSGKKLRRKRGGFWNLRRVLGVEGTALKVSSFRFLLLLSGVCFIFLQFLADQTESTHTCSIWLVWYMSISLF